MHGVVSLLDQNHYEKVEGLWAELARKFGLRKIMMTIPYPHFTYQVAGDYDLTRLEPILVDLAQQQRPFSVKTTGLGIFSGPQPVLYIPVVRSLELSQIQQRVWQALSPAGSSLLDYYAPARWMPHITLEQGDLNSDSLAEVVRWLGGQAFDWEIRVDNFALLFNEGEQHRLRLRVDFA